MRLKGRIVTGAILITVCLLQFPAVTALPYPSGAILGCGGDLCTSVSTWQLSSAFPVVQVTYLNQGNAQTTVLTLGEVKVANTNNVLGYASSTTVLSAGGNGTAYLVLFGLPNGLYNITFSAMTTSGVPLTARYAVLDLLPCCVIV
jgi:hypothetical protein